ncbi:MAG: DUF4209 domain-containing protein [Saprospiraceae bacterium]|nr:DUF4209 domain-containing protein [Candidatus Vicinibacter affinis]
MNFKNLHDLHEYLNSNPKEIKTTNDIEDIIKSSLDTLDPAKESDLISKLEIERAANAFYIDKEELNPKVFFHNKDGQLVAYPTLGMFDTNKFNYLESVLNNTKSNHLKAQYGSLLWHAGKKHTKFLEKAREGYLQLINELLKENETEESRNRGYKYHIIGNYIERLHFISQNLNNTKEIKELVLTLIIDPKHESSFYMLATLMLEFKKVFSIPDFDNLQDLCFKIGSKNDSRFNRISFYELGLRLDNKVSKNTYSWKKLIADEYKNLTTEREDLASITFASKAMRYYKEANEMELSEEMGRLYEEKSKEMELSNIQSKVDVTDLVKYYDGLIAIVFQRKLIEILDFLRFNGHIFPSMDVLQNIVNKSASQASIRYLVANQIFDTNGHIAQHFTTQEEIERLIYLENYHRMAEFKFELLINRFLIKMLEREDWSAENFLSVLESNSWYGNKITKSINSDQQVKISYIDYLKPGIINYFSELRKWYVDRNYIPNFMLSIDSLTLKIECILRELCKLNEIQTFYLTKDDSDREITREKDINMLLRDKDLIQILGKELTMYLKTVFIERVGDNLRNNVAHAFILPVAYYNFISINKIIIALLRLSVWEIENKN